MGFPIKNDHFGVFWGYHHLRKHTDLPHIQSHRFTHCVVGIASIYSDTQPGGFSKEEEPLLRGETRDVKHLGMELTLR